MCDAIIKTKCRYGMKRTLGVSTESGGVTAKPPGFDLLNLGEASLCSSLSLQDLDMFLCFCRCLSRGENSRCSRPLSSMGVLYLLSRDQHSRIDRVVVKEPAAIAAPDRGSR